MVVQDTLLSTISSLINRRAEGAYWDFKREHHKRKADLIHDVLCLANSKHAGDRFLIFGVDDKNFSLHPINTDAGRRTQTNFAGLFRSNANKFFQRRFPEFYLNEIILNGILLDVLVITDAPHKPYYLVEKYDEVRPHHIYTRVCDTNTPINDTAQPHDIERMWRERFGLDRSPLQRVKLYLSHPAEWSLLIDDSGSNANFYHSVFPEFTLRVTDAEEHIARHEEWTRGEIRSDNNHAGYYEILYHQTRLARVRYVSFDDYKKSMVAPDTRPLGAGSFYFYKADSINYAVQKFYSTIEGEDHSTTLSIRGKGEACNEARLRWGYKLKIPVLRAGELDRFLNLLGGSNHIDQSSDNEEQYELYIRNLLDFEDWRLGPT